MCEAGSVPGFVFSPVKEDRWILQSFLEDTHPLPCLYKNFYKQKTPATTKVKNNPETPNYLSKTR